ncbi:MAG: hypothetical protein SynsKO_21750 [Synoicihabitans sp.]
MHRRSFLLLLVLTIAPAFRGISDTPPPASAYLTKLAASPEDDRILFAATNGSGFYRSSDAGDHWEEISPHPDFRHYNIAVFDPQNPARLFTGGRDSGLWVSADQGDSWEQIAFPQTSILSLVIHPRDAKRIFVLTPDGIHRSTTGAAGLWQHVFDYPRFVATAMDVPWPNPDWPVQFSRFQHLTLDPHAPDTLYLGARWEGGYHRSIDGGDTWHHHAIGPIFRRGDRIVVDPANPRILYAETHHQGMFKSYNRGQSWVSSSHGIAPQKRTPHYGAVLISGSAFDPANPAIIYAGSDYSNWKTTDAGATWHELGSTLSCEFARSFLVTSRAVYAGTNVGIYRSFDGGATWTSANRGFPQREIIAQTTGVVGNEQFEFAATQGRPAVYRRSLQSNSDWVSISWLLYETADAISFDRDNQSLRINTPEGVYQSTDGGLRWNIPPTTYENKPLQYPQPPPITGPFLDGFSRFSVAIHGAPIPDDTLVDAWYQRPPYVALAIVGSGYPEDGSSPLWTSDGRAELSGVIAVPLSDLSSEEELHLRVEIRDFQFGTRVGSAPIDSASPIIVPVEL